MDDSTSSTSDQLAPANIKPFYFLLNELGKDLFKAELHQMHMMCRGHGIPEEHLRGDSAVQLLTTLDKNGIIGEDTTDFLKEILEEAGHVVGREMVEEYEKEREKHLQNVKQLLGRHDPLFVGRTSFVRKILEVFQESHSMKCRCVLVYGLAGTGKTKVAVESCVVYKMQHSGTRLLRVNLSKATTAREVWLRTLQSLTGKQISQKQFEITLVKDWILNCSQDTIVYMDNADDILKSSSNSKTDFIKTLNDMLTLENSLVKILITSRHPVESDISGHENLPNFVEIKLEALSVQESIALLTKKVTQSIDGQSHMDNLRDETSLAEISKLCGYNPQALRAVASRLSAGFNPKLLVEHLKGPDLVHRVLDENKDFEGQSTVLRSLSVMYEELSEPLKEALLKLSVFPSSFTLVQGAQVLGDVNPDAAMYDLDDLKILSLVDQDQLGVFNTGLNADKPHYSVHPLVRSVSRQKIQSSIVNKELYEGALRRFVDYVVALLTSLEHLGQLDFPKAFAKYELNKTNVLYFLELDKGNKLDKATASEHEPSKPVPLPQTRDVFYSMFETFLDPSKRLEYYECKSQEMLRQNEIEGWAYLKGWVGDEQVDQAEYDRAWKTVEEPLRVLQKRAITNDSERAKAQLMYVKGRVLTGRREYDEAITMLGETLKIQRRLLGDHTATARCLNALGHANYNKAEEDRLRLGVNDAHRYHKEAWDMLDKITNGHPKKHFHAPQYLLNIGASYHQMGKTMCEDDKAKVNFRLAIESYKEALELVKSLKLTQIPSTAYILKNMAMSYFEMKEYEEALPLATEAGDIRVRTMDNHPATARNLYFVGSVHESIGDKHRDTGNSSAANQHFADALEYFERAFQAEINLGPKRRSSEYDYLKDDLEKLLNKLHMDKELENFRRKVKIADKDLGTSHQDSVSTMPNDENELVTSRHHKRPYESTSTGMDGDGEAQGDEDRDGDGNAAAGSSKQRPPGPVYLEERPKKMCKCS